jgi:hypothetical protein
LIQFEELAPGIILYDNVFPNAAEHIKAIEASGLEWKPAPVLLDPNKDEGGTNYQSRNTDVMPLPHPEDLGDDILSNFVKDFHTFAHQQLMHYISYYGAQVQKFEKPQLLRYGKEQKFDSHVDDHPFFTRRISMTFYINDEYSGGEIVFDRFGIEVSAKKNQLLVFPSNYPYKHKVKPVLDGTRYVVVQWIA